LLGKKGYVVVVVVVVVVFGQSLGDQIACSLIHSAKLGVPASWP